MLKLKKKLRAILNFLIFLSLGIVLLYFAFRNISFQALLSDLKNANYFWILLSLLLGFLGFVVRAYRWKMLIEPLGFKPPLKDTFHALMTGYLANFTLPRFGEVTRCATLNRTNKVPMDALIGTVIIERTIDMIVLLGLLVIVFFARINFFGHFLKTQVFDPLYEKIIAALNFPSIIWIAIISVIIILVIVFIYYRSKFSDLPFYRKTKKIILGIFEGLKTVFSMKRRRVFVFHTVLLWFIYFLMTWVVVYSIPETSHLTALDGLFLLVVGTLGMAAPVQGGIGAFHWIIYKGLTIYGISREKGLVYATLSHESQTLLVIILGAYSFLMIFLERKKRKRLSFQAESKTTE